MPSLPRTYPELDRYIGLLPDLEGVGPEELRARALAMRRLDAGVKLLNYLLKLLSQIGLVGSLAGMVLALVFPAVLIRWADVLVGVLLTSLVVKIYGSIVDLEYPMVQAGVMLFVVLLLGLTNPPVLTLVVSVGGVCYLLILVSNHAQREVKRRSLAWMLHDPEGFAEEVRATFNEVHEELERLGFHLAPYARHFQLDGSKKRPEPTAVPADEPPVEPFPHGWPGAPELPGTGYVRVEAWQRDPRRDLSSIKEFSVCCFLGGSQDTSAFDFLMSPAVEMLDMVGERGRVVRVIMMFCAAPGDGGAGPLLIANAVLGRERGLVGSHKQDNRFIREQIEAYARFRGCRRLLYNVIPTNKRPRQFVSFLLEETGYPRTRMDCRIPTAFPLKLEIFNRRNPGDNVYMMLLLEMLSTTDNYAVAGSVRGLEADPFPPLPELDASAHPGSEARTTMKLLGSEVEAPAALAGETAQAVLKSCATALPELSTEELPGRIRIRQASGEAGPALGGDVLAGRVTVHPGLLGVEDAFWRQALFALTLVQRVAVRLHPQATREHGQVPAEPLLVRVLEAWHPELGGRIVQELPYLAREQARLGVGGDGDLLTFLIDRAVLERYDPMRVFKRHELLTFLQEEGDGRPEARAMADAFVEARYRDYAGFREKYLQGLDDAQTRLVLAVMKRRVAGVMEEILEVPKLEEDYPIRPWEELRERVRRWEKMVSKYRLQLEDGTREKLERLKRYGSLCHRLEGIETRIDKGHEDEAREKLAELKEREGEDLKRFGLDRRLSELRRYSYVAWADRLVERLNLEQYH